jgi:hypothetical protein
MPRSTLSIRVDDELRERLEKLLTVLSTAYPTFRLSTSDAARMALIEGISVLEKRHSERKHKP